MADGVHKYPIDPTLTTGAAGTADGNAGVNLTEGVTQVNAINNAMRGLIGDIGSWRDDVSGANTTTGSANTYVLATTSGLTSLQDGLTLTFLINVTNTGASTLNVDTLGAKKLLASGASLVAGNLVAGQPVTVVYDASADSSAGAWLVANPVPVAASVSYDSDDISNVSTVSGTNVSDALETNAAAILLKAPLADPTFTGVPAAPTAAADTNTTQIATTAYVQTELGDYAPLASPALTGNPTAPTQALGNNSTRIATTAFVTGEIAALSSAGLVPIAQAVASASAAIDFTGLNSALYESYLITVRNLKFSTFGNIRVRVSTDGGATFDSTSGRYNSALHTWGATSTTPSVTANRLAAEIVLSIPFGGPNVILSGEISLIGIDRAAITQVIAQTTLAVTASSDALHSTVVGMHMLEEVHNAVRLYPSAGNFASGTFTLYGRKAP
jgi:hypothetical protein